MAKTVIDSLIVTLGLDPKDFKKGEKEAAAALLDLKKTAKETGEEVSKSADKGGQGLLQFAKRAAVVAAVFKTVKWATSNILDASKATYELGNASRFLGENARNLRNFENIGEMFGSTAANVEKSIRSIKGAVHDLAYNGQMSQQLVQLGRLGVQFQNKDGRARDFKDIYLDTASALGRQVSSGQMTESDALMFAESAGFDPGLARSMVGGRDSAAHALARQEARRQVSDADIAAATANEQAITSAGQAKETAFTAGQTNTSGAITRIAGAVEGAYAGGATGDASIAWEAFEEAITPVTNGLGDLADSVKRTTDRFIEWGNATGGRTRGIRNNNPGNIRAVGSQRADADGFRVFDTMEQGVTAADAQLTRYAGRNVDTIAKIVSTWAPSNENDTQGYIADIERRTGIDRTKKLEPWDRATVLSAMFTHENGVANSSQFDTASVADMLSMASQASESRTGAVGGTTNVDIGEVNVVTQATDAGAMADGAAGALRRKLTASQAEQGMQ